MAYGREIALQPFGPLLAFALQEKLVHLPSPLRTWIEQITARSPSPNDFLNQLYASHFDIKASSHVISIEATILVFETLSLGLDWLPVELVLDPNDGNFLQFDVRFQLIVPGSSQNRYSVVLEGIEIGLRLNTSILTTVNASGIPSGDPLDVMLGEVVISLDQDLNAQVLTKQSVSIPECMIGDSGVIISAQGIDLTITGGKWGFEKLVVRPPKDLPLPDLTIQNGSISNSGFSGEVMTDFDLTYDPNKKAEENKGLIGDAVGNLFGAFTFGVRRVALKFDKNSPVLFNLEGLMVIPVLDNDPLEAIVGLGERREFQISLKGVGAGSPLKLTKEQLFELQVNSVAFRRTAEETGLTVSGDLQLTHPKIKEYIPKIGLEGFSILKRDNKWNFRLEGGSVQINKSINLFEIARADINEIGIGERDGWNVFTFSGGVQLLEGVDAGAWVEGLRFPWREKPTATPPIESGGLTLDGIGLRVVVPDSFGFTGAAEHVKEAQKSYFRGQIDLTLIPLGMGFKAGFEVGRNSSCQFAFLSADFCLPGPGIQLGSLPLYLRCMGGLIGVNTTPDANTLQEYYPLAARQPQGLASPSKWRDECGSHAIGVSATIATANPKAFVMDALLAYVHPEMQLLIEGQSWVLGKPEPPAPFHSVMALDLDDLVALINIAAKYEFIKGVLNVDGMCEAYFSPDMSYVALGQVRPYFPVDRPVKAKVLQLFDATSYLILKSKPERVWALGASIGLPKKGIDLSFASVNFEALIKGAGEMYWGPEQFKGSLNLSGTVAFRIFRKGFDLALAARVLGMTPDWLVDALLKFSIRFKILWRKFKFGGELPFHWERRIRPPLPELLKEIRLQHALSNKTWAPYLSSSCDSRPSLAAIPTVEPDALVALTFHFPMNDRTGYAFGQDVSVLQPHKSGDYNFVAELLGGDTGNWGIELHRMKLSDYDQGTWCSFTDGRTSVPSQCDAGQPQPVLYGAWQADQAPDGTKGRTHLHLFARTPFSFNVLNRFPKVKALQIYDHLHMVASEGVIAPVLATSKESLNAIASAGHSMLRAENPAGMNIPVFQARLKSFKQLRSTNTPFPLGALQTVVHRDPSFPRTRITPTKEHCRNFLRAKPGWYGKDSVIDLSGDVLLGAYGSFKVPGQTDKPVILGNAEIVVDDLFPYPLRFLRLHDNRGIQDPTKKIVSGTLESEKGWLKIAVKHPVKRVTVQYDGPSKSRLEAGKIKPSLQFYAAFEKPFSVKDFWTFSKQVKPAPIDTSEPGRLVISCQPNTTTVFNEIAFIVFADTRIYSICYEIDFTAELADKEDQLKRFIGIGWPKRPAASGPARPTGDGVASGPASLDKMAANDVIGTLPNKVPIYPGSIVPGYVYKLIVRTSHTMTDGDASQPRLDSYCALFQVSRPLSNLSPYVLTTYPKDSGFPHYRAHEFYIRFCRNDVHILMGSDHSKLTWNILREGEPIASLPFQNGRDADLSSFLRSTSSDCKGWGWGKANSHVFSREESVWMEAYNNSAMLSVPPAQQVSEDMAVPDDMMWVYPINPILLRAGFNEGIGLSRPPSPGDASSAIPHFQNPIDEGLPMGRWGVEASLLTHTPVQAAQLTGLTSAPASFLLTENTFVPPYRLSVWLRPRSDKGHVGIVIAANQELNQYLLIKVDPVAQRVRLIRKNTGGDPAVRAWSDRTIGLGKTRWSRLFVRLTTNANHLVVTVELSDQVVLSEVTDLPGGQTSSQFYAGLFASADYEGDFDNFEVLSIDRLDQLPRPNLAHHLALMYGNDTKPMYKTTFVASQYLDLFDHLNSWDRAVWKSNGNPSEDNNDLVIAVDQWIANNGTLLTSLGDLALAEQEYAAKNRTLEDLDRARKLVREVRYDMDEHFTHVARLLGFELAPRPERFEFLQAANRKGILIQCPEPIDWTRIKPDPLEFQGESKSLPTQLLYSSDLTRGILLIRPTETSIGFFDAGRYVWTIQEFIDLPQHLSWLQGWVTHRRTTYKLTLDMPENTP
jgi:hypothetical protein